ncbi:MAG: hypothetical protein IT170_02595, partial [Bryobacterales bacterium]|nr:hypothetical protein [Bryobacterales bacterium]
MLDQFAEFPLFLAHPGVGRSAGTAGAGLDLRAIDGDVTQLDQTGFAAQLESFDEERGQRFEVLPAEVGDGVVIRVLIGG